MPDPYSNPPLAEVRAALKHRWDKAHSPASSDHSTPPPADPANPSPTVSPPDPVVDRKSSNPPTRWSKPPRS